EPVGAGGAGHELHVDHNRQKEGPALVGGNRLQLGLQLLGGQNQIGLGDLLGAHRREHGGGVGGGSLFLGGRSRCLGGLGPNRRGGERDGQHRRHQRGAHQACHRSGGIG